ncbi:4-oxalocrotonate tautomerase family protein [Nonomuraea typhae]|uniref:4-oxalocrotonate tautomerase family protein n=1 Tax=Nonomuraea typhae TaxID=2603600 RepID=A0ABW7Z2F8_9ACTN
MGSPAGSGQPGVADPLPTRFALGHGGSAEQKQELIVKVTDLYCAMFGEAVRDNTMVLVDEVDEV